MAGPDKAAQEAEVLKAFLADRRALVVDANSVARCGLIRTLTNLGARTKNINSAENFNEAKNMIAEHKPSVILTEFTLEGGTGFQLALESAKVTPSEERIFALVTCSATESEVAQAAEEDIDLFVLKPYTVKGLSEKLGAIAAAKTTPSHYSKAISIGKKLIQDGKPVDATSLLGKAESLHPKPSLAAYYQGVAKLSTQDVKGAVLDYERGLQIHPTHYKCVIGLFDLQIEQKNAVEAYKIGQKITKTFPTSPKRLIQVLTLAVQTRSYADIDSYYEMFVKIELKTPDLIRCICAALIVSGKQALREGVPARGIELLRKAAISAAGNDKMLREAAACLIEHQQFAEAQAVMTRFPPASRSGANYLVAYFLLYDAEVKDSRSALNQLNKISNEGVKDPVLSYWQIIHLIKTGKTDQAEIAVAAAVKEWPAKKEMFERAFAGAAT